MAERSPEKPSETKDRLLESLGWLKEWPIMPTKHRAIAAVGAEEDVENSNIAAAKNSGVEARTLKSAINGDNGMFVVNQTVGSVLCCQCGVLMAPNAANMCVKCLRSEVDITEGLQRKADLSHCPECDKYLQPPRTWLRAKLESKELLTFCIKRLNLSKVRLVNAEFIWTEPHSKRIKVKLIVQKEVLCGAVLQQSFTVEFTQREHMCESCTRVQANPDQWVAAMQLRQHVSHRRTFFYLEQMILKHGAAAAAIKVTQMEHGIDFFFSSKSLCQKFVEFVKKFVPVKHRSDEQLVSHDVKSNTCHFKYTFSVEISPVCRDDLICLPPKLARSLGNIGPLVICTKVSNRLTLFDPSKMRYCSLTAKQYWASSFKSLLTCRQLVEYVVLGIELVPSSVNVGKSRYVLAEALVARVSDSGKNNIEFKTKTHLGHLLSRGDHALGYDLRAKNINDIEMDNYKGLVIPDVILVKKSCKEKRARKRSKSSSGTPNVGPEKMKSEYEQFLKDLEENPDKRFKISLSDTAPLADLPSDALEELLADLDLSD